MEKFKVICDYVVNLRLVRAIKILSPKIKLKQRKQNINQLTNENKLSEFDLKITWKR